MPISAAEKGTPEINHPNVADGSTPVINAPAIVVVIIVAKNSRIFFQLRFIDKKYNTPRGKFNHNSVALGKKNDYICDMDDENRTYRILGLIGIAILMVIMGYFILWPRFVREQARKKGDSDIRQVSLVERLFGYRKLDIRNPQNRNPYSQIETQRRPGGNEDYYPTPEQFDDSTRDRVMREWKEETYGDPNKRISPANAIGASRRACVMSVLRSYYVSEMQNFAENNEFISDKSKLYPSGSNHEPYEIEIYTFGNDSMIIMAWGNLDRDEGLDIIRVDSRGEFILLKNDLAK